MKEMLRIFVGLIAYLICSAPFGGLVFLMGTVVCTAGITLLLWLPAFWLIGFIILSLYDIFASGNTVASQEEKVNAPDKNQMVFIQYIQKERTAGVNDQQIALALKDAGWTDSDIQAAFKYADSIK